MDRQPLTPSLLAEFYDLEEDTYRLARRETDRMGRRPPSAALQAVVAHAGASLDDLQAHARRRRVGLGTARALAADTVHRVRDLVVGLFVDEEHAYRRSLTTMRRGVDLARLLHAAAIDEGDDELARYCQRWISAREQLVSEVVEQLEWFARHPMFSRSSLGSLARASW